jgi:hypothetical protein
MGEFRWLGGFEGSDVIVLGSYCSGEQVRGPRVVTKHAE